MLTDRSDSRPIIRLHVNCTVVQALREAVREEMRRDEQVFVLGEDIRIGGSFSVHTRPAG